MPGDTEEEIPENNLTIKTNSQDNKNQSAGDEVQYNRTLPTTSVDMYLLLNHMIK